LNLNPRKEINASLCGAEQSRAIIVETGKKTPFNWGRVVVAGYEFDQLATLIYPISTNVSDVSAVNMNADR
jgi:hypothetical protein